MFWLKTFTEKIQELVDEGTPESLTYAALESRLAIERVCYERLQIAHDYISHADLKKWQPGRVVTTLISEVDGNIAGSLTVSISKTPAEPGSCSREDFEKHEYVEIGKQVGFDPARLGRLWNALGNFLHVRMPMTKDAELATYADATKIRSKVEEVLGELRQLESGTLITSGVGETVYFHCGCGSKNIRRAALLNEGQTVSCINPDCAEKWTVRFEGGEISFERRSIPVRCHACAQIANFGESALLNLPRNHRLRFVCRYCGAENYLLWKLLHVKKAPAQ